MKYCLLSLLSIFYTSFLLGQDELNLDSLHLKKLNRKYSIVISYKKANYATQRLRYSLAKHKNKWMIVYWVPQKSNRKTAFEEPIFVYKEKKQRIPTIKGDAIFSIFKQENFSELDIDSLNIQIAPNATSIISLSHCPTESIYFYQNKKGIKKQAYCMLLYYKSAPNAHKDRFVQCRDAFLELLKEENILPN